MTSISVDLAEFARRPSLRQRLSAKLLGHKRRGKKRAMWAGLAAGGTLATIGAVGLATRKRKGVAEALSVSPQLGNTKTPAATKDGASGAGSDRKMNVRPTNADTAARPREIVTPQAMLKPGQINSLPPTARAAIAPGLIVTAAPKDRQSLKPGSLVTPPPSSRPRRQKPASVSTTLGTLVTPPPAGASKKQRNSDRVKRRLAALAAGASSNKSGAYKDQQSMLKSFRSTGKKKKTRSTRNDRIRRVREGTVDYSLTQAALARFARAHF